MSAAAGQVMNVVGRASGLRLGPGAAARACPAPRPRYRRLATATAGCPSSQQPSRSHCAWPGTKPTEVAGESWPELENPAPNRLIGHVEPALGQEFLHVAVAQREPEIEPDRVSDDLGWELMTGVGDGLHAPTLPPSSVGVTEPSREVRHGLINPRCV